MASSLSPRLFPCNLGPSGNAGDITLNGHGFVHVDFDVAAFELIEPFTELPALLVLIEVRGGLQKLIFPGLSPARNSSHGTQSTSFTMIRSLPLYNRIASDSG